MKMLSQFQTVGGALFNQRMVSSCGGNLSVRIGDRLIITHRGSMLGFIREADLVETGINKNDRATPLASSELAVHRSIYTKSPAQATVHAHPPYAVALSFVEKEIVPSDSEGKAVLSKVPIIGLGAEVKAGCFAEEIAEALKEFKVVLVRSHGSFAVGQLLEEAYYYTTLLEHSCQLLYLLKVLKATPGINLIQ
jgi:L-fuculose-phosphate aldolase